MTLTSAALWALVIALGLQTGAGLFETRVLVPLWSSDPPASLAAYLSQPIRPDSGRRFWIILSPITAVISLLNLVLAILSTAPMRAWWIASAAGSVTVMAATFGYFVPALLSMARDGANTPPAKARRWVVLNYFRAVLIVAAWIAALKAFSVAL
jgi:hypothetical protein